MIQSQVSNFLNYYVLMQVTVLGTSGLAGSYVEQRAEGCSLERFELSEF
jgi:hypothetical protein